MAFDLQAGGHRFDFIAGICMRCKMSRKTFEDSGRPQCTGRPPNSRKPLPVRDDDPPGVA
jgi:hypothetical protein